MRAHKILFLSLLAAFIVPFLQSERPSETSHDASFPGWPAEFMGREILEVPLTDTELRFATGFPGKIGRFNDGQNDIVLRWISRETRSLHPAADCLKGSGFEVSPAPIMVDQNGARWGCSKARRGNDSRLVCERIYDSKGNSWSDVSAWYWSAAINRTEGPWWSASVAFQQ